MVPNIMNNLKSIIDSAENMNDQKNEAATQRNGNPSEINEIILTKTKALIEYYVKAYNPWKDALSQAGKSSSKYKYWLNVKELSAESFLLRFWKVSITGSKKKSHTYVK